MSALGLVNTSYFPVTHTSGAQAHATVTPVQKQVKENHQQQSTYQYWQVQPNIRSERAVATYEQFSRNKDKEQRVNQLARVDLYA
ncbi:hypothetical protein [Piscirickettsia litoralis]|uniref:Uncharacterized protein n=1 Tax=Piscirickettsia litoralis TaxID=1891921 RepID=A0ABX3A870_9GAMM|nr:hypothetical protein [Piscirickettsia litoralis]ODN42314.1 hypothetical protein BGC07_04415 [Piscirickettsia litoralis]